jgi:hypothetical protein
LLGVKDLLRVLASSIYGALVLAKWKGPMVADLLDDQLLGQRLPREKITRKVGKRCV